MEQSFAAFIRVIRHFPEYFPTHNLNQYLSIDDINTLNRAGILTRGSDLEEIPCPNCEGDHWVELYVKEKQHYYQCPATIEPNSVMASRLTVWKFQVEPFLLLLGTRLQVKLSIEKQAVDDGLWQMGLFIRDDIRHCCYYYQGKKSNAVVDFIQKLPRKDYRYIVFTPHSQEFDFKDTNKRVLAIDIAEMVIIKAKSISINKKYWEDCLSHGFKTVEFDPSNGDLCVKGEPIASIKPSTSAYHFASRLWSDFNMPISHSDIVMYVAEQMGKYFEDTDGNFCYKQKDAIKKLSSKPKLIQQIFETTSTPKGEHAFRMRNPVK